LHSYAADEKIEDGEKMNHLVTINCMFAYTVIQNSNTSLTYHFQHDVE